MQKCLLLLFFFCCGLSASAQWTVAPELGLSAFRRNMYEWRPAVKVGATVEYQFHSAMSVESGVYYTQRGFSLMDQYLSEYGALEEPSLVRHMIQVPLRATFSYPLNKDTRIFLGAGPYLGIYFANNWRNTILHEHDDYGNTAEIGMSLCAGIEVRRFYVRLGYDRSLNGCIYNAATITFGYRF